MAINKKRFKVVIERDEDGFLVASVPALPGCHTQAKNLHDLSLNIKDAIRLCLKVAETNSRYRKQIKELSYEPTFVGLDVVTV